MSQGKAWDKEEVIEVLRPYFRLGCSVTKACKYAGVPQSTVATWVSEDEELRLKVTSWQNTISSQARRVLSEAINSGDKEVAMKWLSKKEKDEFSDRSELTGEDGGAVKIQGVDITIRK